MHPLLPPTHRTSFVVVESAAVLRDLFMSIVVGAVVGVVGGGMAAIFLYLLRAVTLFRTENSLIILALPAAGYAIGWAIRRYGVSSVRGTNLIIEALESEDSSAIRVPLRLAPVSFLGGLVSHLFGASTASVGAALQFSATLADSLWHRLNLRWMDRRSLLVAGLSAGFATVVGAPVAACFFALEARRSGSVRYDALIPSLVAALIGNGIAQTFGVGHIPYPLTDTLPITPLHLIQIGVFGVLCGWLALLFVEFIRLIRRYLTRRFDSLAWRAAVGGVGVVLLTLLAGTTIYNGLSTPLIYASLSGETIPDAAFAWKLALSVISIGAGFLGGDVTPLFVIGSTFGAAIAPLFGIDQGVMASLGFGAVLAGAGNVPMACMIMGVELFGSHNIVFIAVVCFVAYLASGHRSLYSAQVIGTAKTKLSYFPPHEGETLEDYQERRKSDL